MLFECPYHASCTKLVVVGCAQAKLPHGARPILCASRSARLLIISQATRQQGSSDWYPVERRKRRSPEGLEGFEPFDLLRREKNRDPSYRFCHPGAAANGGDKPPRPECAPLWHGRVLDHLPNLQLTLLVGQYSQKRYLGSGRKSSMTETVKAFPEYGPKFFPLPHPSWRSGIWMQRQPWFEQEVIPQLRRAVRRVVKD